MIEITDIDRSLAPAVLKRAGVLVSPEIVELWTGDQLAQALVWADSVQLDRPIEKPKHLASGDDGVSVKSALCGRRVEGVEMSGDDGVRLCLDGGTWIKIRLEGD